MRAQHIGTALLLSLVAAAPAAADTRDVSHFADPFGGSVDCNGFVDNFEGHDRGTVTNFSRDGVPYRQVGHIHAIETDTNSVTGKSVVVRTDVNVLGDLDPDGNLVSFKVTGQFNVGTLPGQGIVIHDTGLLLNVDGVITALRGHHDVFDNPDGAFCDAIS